MNLTESNLRPLGPEKELAMTYSVTWEEVNKSFAKRFDAYLDYPFFEHQVLSR